MNKKLKKRYIILRVVLYSMALGLIAFLIYFERQQISKANAQTQNRINLLMTSKIAEIAVIQSGNRKLMSRPEINEIQEFLKKAELCPTSLLGYTCEGYKPPYYEYQLFFKFKKGGMLKFLGKIYIGQDWNKDNLYLEDESIPIGYRKPLRIEGFGKWFIENVPPK